MTGARQDIHCETKETAYSPQLSHNIDHRGDRIDYGNSSQTDHLQEEDFAHGTNTKIGRFDALSQ